MRWLIYLAVTLTVLIGVAALIGYFLPVKHDVSRSAEFNRSPHEVYALISDLQSYREWWPENATNVAIIENTPPVRFTTKIIGETAFGGTWTIDVVPTANGSRMTVTERGEIHNVIFRTLSKFVFGYTSTMESFLRAAQRQLTTHN
jgi:hypothetical protein